MGGTPVFVGTRVPLATLLDYLEAGQPLSELLEDFPTVTREAIEWGIFAVSFRDGTLVPTQPLYWDLGADGTTSVFLRNVWIGG
jgi:hypothetical protein